MTRAFTREALIIALERALGYAKELQLPHNIILNIEVLVAYIKEDA